jgi:hypothetical protein
MSRAPWQISPKVVSGFSLLSLTAACVSYPSPGGSTDAGGTQGDGPTGGVGQVASGGVHGGVGAREGTGAVPGSGGAFPCGDSGATGWTSEGEAACPGSTGGGGTGSTGGDTGGTGWTGGDTGGFGGLGGGSGAVCTDGTVVPTADGCNTCTCHDDTWLCALIACP